MDTTFANALQQVAGNFLSKPGASSRKDTRGVGTAGFQKLSNPDSLGLSSNFTAAPVGQTDLKNEVPLEAPPQTEEKQQPQVSWNSIFRPLLYDASQYVKDNKLSSPEKLADPKHWDAFRQQTEAKLCTAKYNLAKRQKLLTPEKGVDNFDHIFELVANDKGLQPLREEVRKKQEALCKPYMKRDEFGFSDNNVQQMSFCLFGIKSTTEILNDKINTLNDLKNTDPDSPEVKKIEESIFKYKKYLKMHEEEKQKILNIIPKDSQADFLERAHQHNALNTKYFTAVALRAGELFEEQQNIGGKVQELSQRKEDTGKILRNMPGYIKEHPTQRFVFLRANGVEDAFSMHLIDFGEKATGLPESPFINITIPRNENRMMQYISNLYPGSRPTNITEVPAELLK